MGQHPCGFKSRPGYHYIKARHNQRAALFVFISMADHSGHTLSCYWKQLQEELLPYFMFLVSCLCQRRLIQIYSFKFILYILIMTLYDSLVIIMIFYDFL